MSKLNENIPKNAPTNMWPIVSSLDPTRDAISASTNDDKSIPTRLIVHFDINETVLLGDEAGGDSRRDSLQKMLAKSAYCQMPPANKNNGSKQTSWEDTQQMEPTHWWDGQLIQGEITVPPLYTGWEWPEGCCPYYRTKFKRVSKSFCSHHGTIYHDLFNHCQTILNEAAERNDNSPILPSLWNTLAHLSSNEKEQPFNVVFRTFGTDLPDIARAVTKFATGNHPDYPTVHESRLELSQDRLFQGRWTRNEIERHGNEQWIYQLWDTAETTLVASGDAQILEVLESLPICGIRDDYDHWAGRGWHPSAGKPIWIPSFVSTEKSINAIANDEPNVFDHHILFDDNIHNLSHDGIACIRRETDDTSQESSNKTITFATLTDSDNWRDYHGIHLVRVPTIEPVLDPDWYIHKLEQAQRNLQLLLNRSP